MKSQDDLSYLPSSILPKLWSFAWRLCQNERGAEKLVLRACASWLSHENLSSRTTTPLIGIFSIICQTWLAENDERGKRVKLLPKFFWNRRRRPRGKIHKSETLPLDPIEAIQELPYLRRIAMILVYAEGLNRQEAADVLGVPLGRIEHLLQEA
jgi:RNA polymerase sigma-70 factor, ECF subfamily